MADMTSEEFRARLQAISRGEITPEVTASEVTGETPPKKATPAKAQLPTQGDDAGTAVAAPKAEAPKQEVIGEEEQGWGGWLADKAVAAASGDVYALMGTHPSDIVEKVTGSSTLGDIAENVYTTGHFFNAPAAIPEMLHSPARPQRTSTKKESLPIEESKAKLADMAAIVEEFGVPSVTFPTQNVGGKQGYSVASARRDIQKSVSERLGKEWQAEHPDRRPTPEEMTELREKAHQMVQEPMARLKARGEGLTLIDIDSKATTDWIMKIPGWMGPARTVAALLAPETLNINDGDTDEFQWMHRSAPKALLDTIIKMISPSSKIGPALQGAIADGRRELERGAAEGDETSVLEMLAESAEAVFSNMYAPNREAVESMRRGETAFDQGTLTEKGLTGFGAHALGMDKGTAEQFGYWTSWGYILANIGGDVASPELRAANASVRTLKGALDSKYIGESMKGMEKFSSSIGSKTSTIDEIPTVIRETAKTYGDTLTGHALLEQVAGKLTPSAVRYVEDLAKSKAAARFVRKTLPTKKAQNAAALTNTPIFTPMAPLSSVKSPPLAAAVQSTKGTAPFSTSYLTTLTNEAREILAAPLGKSVPRTAKGAEKTYTAQQKAVAQAYIDAQKPVIEDAAKYFEKAAEMFPKAVAETRKAITVENAAKITQEALKSGSLQKSVLLQAAEQQYGADVVASYLKSGSHTASALTALKDGLPKTRSLDAILNRTLQHLDEYAYQFQMETGPMAPASQLLRALKDNSQLSVQLSKTVGEKYLNVMGRFGTNNMPFPKTGAVSEDVQDVVRSAIASKSKIMENITDAVGNATGPKAIDLLDKYIDSSGLFTRVAEHITEQLAHAENFKFSDEAEELGMLAQKLQQKVTRQIKKGVSAEKVAATQKSLKLTEERLLQLNKAAEGLVYEDPAIDALARAVLKPNPLRGASAVELGQKRALAVKLLEEASQGNMGIKTFLERLAGGPLEHMDSSRTRVLVSQILAAQTSVHDALMRVGVEKGFLASKEQAMAMAEVFETGFSKKGSFNQAIEMLNKLGLPRTQKYATAVGDVVKAEKQIISYQGLVMPRSAMDAMYEGIGALTKEASATNPKTMGPIERAARKSFEIWSDLYRTGILVGIGVPNPGMWLRQFGDVLSGVWGVSGAKTGVQTVSRSIIANVPYFSTDIPLVNTSIRKYLESASVKYGDTPFLQPFMSSVIDPFSSGVMNGRQGFLKLGGVDYDLEVMAQALQDKGIISSFYPKDAIQALEHAFKGNNNMLRMIKSPSMKFQDHLAIATNYQRVAQVGLELSKGKTLDQACKLALKGQFDWMSHHGLLDLSALGHAVPFQRVISYQLKQAAEALAQPLLHNDAFRPAGKVFAEGFRDTPRLGRYAQMQHVADQSKYGGKQDYEDIEGATEEERILKFYDQRTSPDYQWNNISVRHGTEMSPILRMSPLEGLYQLTAYPLLIGASVFATRDDMVLQEGYAGRLMDPVIGMLGPGFQDMAEIIRERYAEERMLGMTKYTVQPGHAWLMKTAGIDLKESEPGSGTYEYGSPATKLAMELVPFLGTQFPRLYKSWAKSEGAPADPAVPQTETQEVKEMFRRLGEATLRASYSSSDATAIKEMKNDMWAGKQMLLRERARIK